MTDNKDAIKLLRALESDPNVVEDDDAVVYLDQQYPVALHHSMKNFHKVKSTMRNVITMIKWNKDDATSLDTKVKAEMLARQQNICTNYLFKATVGNKSSLLSFRKWLHKVNNLVLDAYHACWKDSTASSEPSRFLFRPSESVNLAATANDERNVRGLARFNKILVNHPYESPPNLDALLDELVAEHAPVAIAGQQDSDSQIRQRSLAQLASVKASLKATIRQAHEANNVTFLVLLWDLLPGARDGKSQIFTRIKDHRDKHLLEQKSLESHHTQHCMSLTSSKHIMLLTIAMLDTLRGTQYCLQSESQSKVYTLGSHASTP